jgi:hypothetical protein
MSAEVEGDSENDDTQSQGVRTIAPIIVVAIVIVFLLSCTW